MLLEDNSIDFTSVAPKGQFFLLLKLTGFDSAPGFRVWEKGGGETSEGGGEGMDKRGSECAFQSGPFNGGHVQESFPLASKFD